jgi:class 3 adenylate cyclase/tetratricopeptide (TPR) repeat protein
MRCSSCGAENPEGLKFCEQCATPFRQRCAKCGFENSPLARFCGECATPLEGAARSDKAKPPSSISVTATESPAFETDGERRHLTVLFCDLVGSTEMSAQLDPEEWRELVGDYHRAATQAITRFGGFVAKYLGDGLMAYFGWPAAHDNDAERAARAGLAIVNAVRAVGQRDGQHGGQQLSVRVGIDSGVVVIGRGGGSESEVFGDAPNIASRVQTAADADTVLVTSAVHGLTSGLFVVEPRGAFRLKGVTAPMELFRVVRLSGVRGRLAAAQARGLTPFVGREQELQLLWSRWERALAADGQSVLIAGEAGIGKSRLMQQFRQRLAAMSYTWSECGGAQYFQNTPFYPITDLLEQVFAWRGDESDQEKLAELERILTNAGLNVDEAVPLIAPLVNLPLGEKYSQPQLPAEHRRRRLLTTLAAWVLGAARAQPLVLVIEDLHWVDPSTLEFLQLLGEQFAGVRLLLLLTARPEFQSPWPPDAHHTHLTMDPLSADDVRRMIANVLAQKALSGETVDRVVDRTGGVPLFIEELSRVVLERGESKPAPHAIPATLHDSLMARLDRLGRAKEVAQIASVIGREFSYELLLTVAAIPESDLQSGLEKLGGAELIFARGVPPEATYSFKHALIRDTAYEALLKSRRRELHRRAAIAMTETFPELAATQLEVVARHWTDAGETEPAIAAWRRAADAAFERNAFKEAEETFRQALTMLGTLPESRERDGRELELMNRFARVLQVTRGWASPEAADAAAHALTLAEKCGDLTQLVLQLVGSFAAVVNKGDLPAASAIADRMLERAAHEGSTAMLGLAHVCQVNVCYFRGDLASAEKHFLAGAAMFEDAARKFPAALSALGYASHVAWMRGYPDAARERIRHAVAAATACRSPFELAYAQFLAAMLHLFLREFATAKDAAAASVALSDEFGFKQHGARSKVLLGLAVAALGHLDDGKLVVNQGLDLLRESGAVVAMSLYLSWAGVAQWLSGKLPEALETIDEALQVNPAELSWRPDTIRLRGELHRKLGHYDKSEADYRAAIDLARAIRAKAWELRAAMSLARTLGKRGRAAEARDLLAPLFSGFTEGFDTADLKDAKALLDELRN